MAFLLLHLREGVPHRNRKEMPVMRRHEGQTGFDRTLQGKVRCGGLPKPGPQDGQTRVEEKVMRCANVQFKGKIVGPKPPLRRQETPTWPARGTILQTGAGRTSAAANGRAGRSCRSGAGGDFPIDGEAIGGPADADALRTWWDSRRDGVTSRAVAPMHEPGQLSSVSKGLRLTARPRISKPLIP